MAMLGTLRRANNDNVFVMPTVVVRVVDDEDIVTNSTTSAVGRIREDLVPLQYTQAAGAVGGTLTVRIPAELWLDATRGEDAIETWGGKTITLEMRENTGNKALQRVLFRGKVSSVETEYSPSDNSITLVVADPWFQAADAPVDMPTQGLTVGEVMRSFSRGYYYATRLKDGRVQRVQKLFPQFLFPTTTNGTPLASLDPALLEETRMCGNVSIAGQSFAEAFSDVVEAAYGGQRIPDVDYTTRGLPVYVARVRGARERDLVVGSPGTDRYTERQMCQVKSISGQWDYRSIRNRVVGEGAPIRVIKPVTLSKGWSDAEEAAVRANTALVHTPGYYHVFRRYRAPEAFWAATGQAWGGGDEGKHDQIKFWQRGAPTDAPATDWQQVSPVYEIRRERTTGDTGETLVDNLRELSAEDARSLTIWFQDPQAAEYYTPAQQLSMAAGVAAGSPTVYPYQYEIEAVLVGEPIAVDSGIRGTLDSSRLRTAFVRNPNIVKHVHTGHYTGDGSARQLVANSDWQLRDDSPAFAAQVADMAERMSSGSVDIRVTLWKFDPSWQLGDRCSRVVTNSGRVLLSDLPWYVEGITHDLQMGLTTLSLSQVVGQYIGGAW